MTLQPFQQLIGRQRLLFHVGQHAADADRQRVLVGVQEAGPQHAVGDVAGNFDHHPLRAADVEARIHRFLGQEQHFLHGQRHVVRRDLRPQPGTTADQGIGAISENHAIRVNIAFLALGAHTDHLARAIAQQLGHRGFAHHQGAGLLDLIGKPAVETGADDGVAVVRFLRKAGVAIAHAGAGLIFIHQPHALFDDVPFERAGLAKIGNDLFQGIGVQDRPLHVLGARRFAALQLQHRQPGLGQGVGGAIARRAGTDHDDVKFFH